MYLLRFGLFILSASVSSALSLHPLKVLGGLAALLCLGLQLLDNPVGRFVGNQPTFTFGLLMAGLVLIYAACVLFGRVVSRNRSS